MSQITFSQKPNKSKIVSKHLLGAIDAQDYSLMTNQNEDIRQSQAVLESDVQLDQNMEKFKNNVIEQSRGHVENIESSQNLERDNEFRANQVEMERKNKQEEQVVQRQSLKGDMRKRSTSTSTRFSKKMMSSNLVSSDLKPQRNMQGNVMIYKTTDFDPVDTENSTTIRSGSHPKIQQQKMMIKPEVNQYNFEYSYQDPIYQVYTNQQGIPTENGQYGRPNFTSFQSPMQQGPHSQNPSMMQMSQMSQQNMMRQNKVNSMNAFRESNEMMYINQGGYPNDSQVNTMYDMEEFEEGEEYMEGSDNVVYRPGWKKGFHGRGPKTSKFRPHSNNIRQLQNGEGLWGVKNNFQRKVGGKLMLSRNSGLSKKLNYNNVKRTS